MRINWEVILWTCITLVVIAGVIGVVLAVVSARNIKQRRNELEKVHTGLRAGSQVIFGGGIYATVVKIEQDTVHVEVAKGTVLKISRYAIQSLIRP